MCMGILTVTTNLRVAAAQRHKHNSLDYDCTYWAGDMNPSDNDKKNRELTGGRTALDDRRCLVCHPYTEEESSEVLDALNPLNGLE